jgi:hypothetical protein
VDSTANFELLSFLDVYLGYHQISLATNNEEKTSFITLFGIFCYTKMAFGLKNRGELLSYPVFMPKPCTHRMHDPGSIVPHIRPKVFTDNQMLQIKYNYYYINSISKDYDNS